MLWKSVYSPTFALTKYGKLPAVFLRERLNTSTDVCSTVSWPPVCLGSLPKKKKKKHWPSIFESVKVMNIKEKLQTIPGQRKLAHGVTAQRCLLWKALVVKNPPANAGDTRGVGSVPGCGRSSGAGNLTPLQYLAWKVPWAEEPGGLQLAGPWSDRQDGAGQRAGHRTKMQRDGQQEALSGASLPVSILVPAGRHLFCGRKWRYFITASRRRKTFPLPGNSVASATLSQSREWKVTVLQILFPPVNFFVYNSLFQLLLFYKIVFFPFIRLLWLLVPNSNCSLSPNKTIFAGKITGWFNDLC